MWLSTMKILARFKKYIIIKKKKLHIVNLLPPETVGNRVFSF